MESKEFARKIFGIELTKFQEKILKSDGKMRLYTGRIKKKKQKWKKNYL